MNRNWRYVLAGVAALVIVAAIIAWPHVGEEHHGREAAQAQNNLAPTMMSLLPNQPIAGQQVSLSDAEAEAGFPFPLFQGSLVDPCSGKTVPLSLLQTWMSPPSTAPDARQVALVYNEGIVAVIQPNRSGQLLPPADSEPDSVDAAQGETTVSVAGSPAWLKEMPSGFDCSTATVALAGVSAPPNQSNTATPQILQSLTDKASNVDLSSTAVIFSPITDAVVAWQTKATSVEFGGPFTGATITQLANQATWTTGASAKE
jgi:hypothetical protein